MDPRLEQRGLPPVHHIPLPVTLLDMPQSLCALNRVGTGKEGSSAKSKRKRESHCAAAEELWMRMQRDGDVKKEEKRAWHGPNWLILMSHFVQPEPNCVLALTDETNTSTIQ